MPHLIAHVVRQSPAFDIAETMECGVCEGNGYLDDNNPRDSACHECDGTGVWWIIPTSGHRAYPYWTVDLAEFWLGGEVQVIRAVPDAPQGWPDHYASNDRPLKFEGPSLAQRLGLLKPKLAEPLKRRV